VFETLIRRGGIVAAADELCVTPGAVSKQIGKLEEWFGRPLMRRNGRRLEVTPEATEFLNDIAEALQKIERASTKFKRAQTGRLLRVSAPPTFLTRWLIPRLGQFQRAFPDIRIQLDNRRDRNSALPQHADLAVRRGPPSWPNLIAVEFMSEALTPVCSPELGRMHDVWRPEHLSGFSCLKAGMRPQDWETWLQTNDIGDFVSGSVLEFDHTFLALDAALDGLGFAIGPVYLVADDILAGTLFAPFLDRPAGSEGYFAVHNPHTFDSETGSSTKENATETRLPAFSINSRPSLG
jgi:LysR family glycine cleavage system transcriptional activator